MNTGAPPRVDGDRLAQRLAELAQIGAEPKGGVTRLALTPEDWQARTLFRRRLEEAGLSVRSDPAGNLFGRLEGQEPSLPPVLLGSHLDTVPEGGAFDGALGCVAALEAVASIAAAGVAPRRSLEVVVWTDEEGARFGSGLLGSRWLCGSFSEEELELVDATGMTLRKALSDRGLDPNCLTGRQPPQIAAYLELHIEQGPRLEKAGLPVGIVSGIVGLIHGRVEVEGSAGHAGTTPMADRADALAAAAEMILAVEAAATNAGPIAVGTVGQLVVQPGASNVIPGRCAFTLDIRDQDEKALDRVYRSVRMAVEETASRREVRAGVQETLRLSPVPMSPRLQAALARACRLEGLADFRLPSGAGHDAMILAEVTDAAMLFVRCRGGISHNPAESVLPEDATVGAQVLLDTALELAG